MWTLWVVYFGLAIPPSAFQRYEDPALCRYLAQEVVVPVIREKGITAVALCLPTRDDNDKTNQTPALAPKKFRGQA